MIVALVKRPQSQLDRSHRKRRLAPICFGSGKSDLIKDANDCWRVWKHEGKYVISCSAVQSITKLQLSLASISVTWSISEILCRSLAKYPGSTPNNATSLILDGYCWVCSRVPEVGMRARWRVAGRFRLPSYTRTVRSRSDDKMNNWSDSLLSQKPDDSKWKSPRSRRR